MKNLFGFLEFILIVIVILHIIKGCYSDVGLIKYTINATADLFHYADSVFNK
jgi:hypothetical protein